MNTINNILFLSLLLFMSLLVSSCDSNPVSEESIAAAPAPSEVEEINTRGQQQQVAIKAYHYRTLAAFKKGQAEVSLNDLAALADKQINLVVLYEASAPWAEVFNEGRVNTTGDDNLNGLMAAYNLEIVKQFAIDADNEGLILEPNATLSDPVEAAKELSMVDYVLMVEVKEVPAEDIDESTADIK